MYKSIDLKESPALLEERVRNYWQEKNTHKKSIDNREGAEQFVFFEGPPTANGKPGIHHVMARTLKDSVCRYKTMQGFQVKRKAGWDTHGLPVEIEVEKSLGLDGKPEIEKYGIEAFNKKCKESVFTYEGLWRKMTEQMGYWVDLDNPYITLDNNYIETVWWILNDFFKRDLLYKGHKIVPYCPKCGTPLSSHEVAQGYKDVNDPSVFVKFKAKEMENTYFLAWTTTPWTLLSNVALVVNPKETYVKIKLTETQENLILAKARLSVVAEDYEIVEEYLGQDLEHKRYERLYDFLDVEEDGWFIGIADYVTMDDGTGVVHTAPAFGADDYNIGMKYKLPFINLVDGEGKFIEAVEPWQGIFVKDADKGIIKDMKEREVLYRREQINHSYPHCWRCSSPLIYYGRESWFIRTSQFREELMKNNDTVNWYPGFVGEKRFGEWLKNNIDWALSRDRFWGTPLNVWVCDDCGKLDSVGSIEELRERGYYKDGSKVAEDIELHRPYVDDIHLKCSCGHDMLRTPEVIDCWFDSGAMPFAQWHYPFENKDKFDGELFPADFISEGIDQTRGWFYSLLAISTILKGKAPYKNVLVNDLILDANGIKMSKSKGNTADPFELMKQYGADVIRWYLLYVSPPWVPTKFNEKGVAEILGKFMGTLKNVYSFYTTYANIDKFNASDYEFDQKKTAEIDRWIISRTNTLIKDVTAFNDSYDFTKSVRAIQEFVLDEVSNWFVRRSRRRFWSFELNDDKKDAYATLNFVLETIAKLIAPFAPYMAEDIYTNLTGKESVHLEKYPLCNEAVIDEKLEAEMQTIITLVGLGRSARNTCQIKVRQTLQTIFVPASTQDVVERMTDLLVEEINIKEIKYISRDDDFVHYDMKPNFKVMGPKFGKSMKLIAQALPKEDASEIISAFNKGESYNLVINGETFPITEEDVAISIQQREGYTFESHKDMWVALDTSLTPELIKEGYAREINNKIQFTRKENNFDIMDRIDVFYYADEELAEVFTTFADFIASDTLTDNFLREDSNSQMEEYDINGKSLFMRLVQK